VTPDRLGLRWMAEILRDIIRWQMPYALVIVPASILRLLRVLSKNRSFLWPPMLSQIHFSASSAWKRAANLALRPIGSSSLTRHG